MARIFGGSGRIRYCLLAIGGLLLSLLAACTGADGSGATVGAKAFVTDSPGGWGLTWSYNNFDPHFLGPLYSYAFLPLAITKPTTIGDYIPELATSWSVNSSTITIHLRSGAKWQDGTPFTSKDVLTTFLLQGTNGNQLWAQITGAHTPNANTLVLDLRKGVPAHVVLGSALGISPLPASQYGKYVTPDLQQNLIANWTTVQRQGPDAAAKTTAGKAVAAAFGRLAKFNPKTFVGDGPFQLKTATQHDVIMTKWRGFWDAAKIHVPEVDFIAFASNDDVYPAMFSHHLDLPAAAMPDPITQRWLHTSGAHLLTADNYSQFALYFNCRKAPYNDKRVRQAIAYIIDRNKMTQLAAGGKSPYYSIKYPTGLLHSVQRNWLTDAQLHSLRPYNHDLAKATSLLRSAGFTKKSDHWYTPQGQRWTLQIQGPAGWNDSMADVKVIANMLSDFGISASAQAVEQPGYWTYQYDGAFDLDWGWGGNGGLNPLAGARSVLGNLNYVTTGSYAGKPGIGYGPVVDVPGLGRVNVPQTLKAEVSSVDTGPQMRKLTWDWAQLINRDLPYLALDDKYSQLEYSTTHFGDWPPGSSLLWKLMGLNQNGGVVAAMQQGFIRPGR